MVRLWSSAAWATDAAAMPASTAKLNTDFFTLDSPLEFVIRWLSDKAGFIKRVFIRSPRTEHWKLPDPHLGERAQIS
jgi:hypothetical protein